MQIDKVLIISSRRLLAGAAALLLLLSLTAPAQQPTPSATVRVVARDQADKPVLGVQAQIKRNGVAVSSATTNEQGEAALVNLAPGVYEIVAAKEGFETLTQNEIRVTAGSSTEIRLTLVPKIEIKDAVNIRASAENPVEQGASPAAELQRAQVKNLPNKPATVADVLPLVPGVVRSPQGELTIEGSGEHRSAFLVNSADVTDPATGQFGLTIPIDSVETINVFKTPYLAQYGRFTAGVVSVETRRGGDKWHFEINDPLPVFRVRSRQLRGLREMSPRLVFNGPLIANRLFLSEGFEYILEKRPVRTLSFPRNESKQESYNSFTQLDYIISPAQTLTGTFHAAPQHRNFVNLDFFNPQPVTPSFRARDYTGTVIDRLTLGTNLLESTVGIRRSNAGVGAQGSAEMLLTPTGNRGNYFSSQDRRASRIEWLETFSVHPLNAVGAHNLKFGTTIARTTDRGDFDARPISILDAAGRPVQRIEFAGDQSFNRHDLETGAFGQDHWALTPKLAFDAGVRFERQGITGTSRFAPRIGFAWTPFAHQQTVIRGGVGVFYDRVPLSIYAFDRYPEQVVTKYAPDGTIVDGPRRFANITDQAAASRFPFIRRRNQAGNFAPYSTTWNIELEHNLSNFLRLRANYLSNSSSGVPIVTPGVVQGRDALILGGGGKSSYRQLELTARLSWKEGQEMFFSYVRSRANGDLNEFSRYLGNFPSPVVRPNQSSNLPGDLPNRFLAWGTLKLPWQMQFSPIVEYRSGFPYTVTDVARNYVGTPNQQRFPKFFSFDARISKDFKVNDKYSLRFAVSGFNLTNHFNALDVHANTADPQFGAFFGNYRRRFRVDFDVIY
ncbi:MAG: carboxypeptidase regulatory-like domain-containing protein [Blastocatellales bacterium]